MTVATVSPVTLCAGAYTNTNTDRENVKLQFDKSPLCLRNYLQGVKPNVMKASLKWQLEENYI